MEQMEQLTQKRIKLPKEYVYVHNDDVKRLREGKNVTAYLDITGRDHGDYTLMSSFKFKPAIKIDDNTYDVVVNLL